MYKCYKNTYAFTLVELIVVITILAVLSTIAFISFQGYASNSRDSVRLADMNNISKGFNIKITKDKKLPIPDNLVQITASGILLNYQGDAGVSILGNIGISGGGVDPLDQSFYTYSTNTRRNKFQLLGFFENEDNISFSNTTYADLTNRFPKSEGNELGILINKITKEPIQIEGNTIDIINTVNNFDTYFNNNLSISGTGSVLKKIVNIQKYGSYGSCKSLLQKHNLQNKSGIYTIYTNNQEYIDVYCDMETDGGGWMLITPEMVQENNMNITSDIDRDSNGGLIYNLSDILPGCGGGQDSIQQLKLPSIIQWSSIKYKQDFYGAASCWEIFGKDKSSYPIKTNIIPYTSGVDTIKNSIKMGGFSNDIYDGINRRCDNNILNFWHGKNNGYGYRSAEVILRKNNNTLPSFLSTGLSCVSGGSTFQYSKIYIK